MRNRDRYARTINQSTSGFNGILYRSLSLEGGGVLTDGRVEWGDIIPSFFASSGRRQCIHLDIDLLVIETPPIPVASSTLFQVVHKYFEQEDLELNTGVLL